MSFNGRIKYVTASDKINARTEPQTESSWWIAYAAPGAEQAPFYVEARRQDAERFSRQPKEIPVFNDQRFGAIRPSKTAMEFD